MTTIMGESEQGCSNTCILCFVFQILFSYPYTVSKVSAEYVVFVFSLQHKPLAFILIFSRVHGEKKPQYIILPK